MYITAAEAGRRLGVNVSTVTRWCEIGKLAYHHRTLGGHYRILATEVEKILRKGPS